MLQNTQSESVSLIWMTKMRNYNLATLKVQKKINDVSLKRPNDGGNRYDRKGSRNGRNITSLGKSET